MKLFSKVITQQEWCLGLSGPSDRAPHPWDIDSPGELTGTPSFGSSSEDAHGISIFFLLYPQFLAPASAHVPHESHAGKNSAKSQIKAESIT